MYFFIKWLKEHLALYFFASLTKFNQLKRAMTTTDQSFFINYNYTRRFYYLLLILFKKIYN